MNYETPEGLANVEAEAALLGAILSDNELMTDIGDLVTPKDFFNTLHGRIFAAAQRFIDRNMLASDITLRPMFESDPGIEDVGGTSYLTTLSASGYARVGISDFARQIADLSARRRVHRELHDGQQRLTTDFDAQVTDVAESVNQAALDATARSAPVKRRSAGDAVRNAQNRASLIERGEIRPGLRNKLVTDLDKVIGLAELGTYNILAGRPGMLKSGTAQSAAIGYAANGHPGVLFHCEMSDDQLDIRLTADVALAMGTPISHDLIRAGTLNEQENAWLTAAGQAADSLPIAFYGVGRANVRRLDMLVEREKRLWAEQGRRLEHVWFDYLQLLQIDDDGKLVTDPFKRVGRVSEYLLDMAKRHNVALFALAQVKRDVEDRKDKRPMSSDLRDSGNLEQDADTITFVYRDEYYLAREKPAEGAPEKTRNEWEADMAACKNRVELIGAKHRHGQPRTRIARFIPKSFAVRGGDYPDPEFTDPQQMLI